LKIPPAYPAHSLVAVATYLAERPPVKLQDPRSPHILQKETYLVVPPDSQEDYTLALVVPRQILMAGMVHSMVFQQEVEAVHLEIPVKALWHSERVHSMGIQALRRGNKEPMRPHLAQMKRRLRLLRSAREKLFRHEDDSEHAHFQYEVEFHLLKEGEHFPSTAWLPAVEPRRKATRQGERSHRLKTRLRCHYSQQGFALVDRKHMLASVQAGPASDLLHEATRAMNSHRAAKMQANLNVRLGEQMREDTQLVAQADQASSESWLVDLPGLVLKIFVGEDLS
jgi:hypothetical protein